MSKVVIIGAGQAGLEAATHLRSQGFDGEITLVGSENILPYQRPPLSKKYVLGEMSLERLYLKPKTFYQENDIKLMLGTIVKKIVRGEKKLETNCGVFEYDQLILATGSSPNRLPGVSSENLSGIYYVRDIDDADALKKVLKPGKLSLIHI